MARQTRHSRLPEQSRQGLPEHPWGRHLLSIRLQRYREPGFHAVHHGAGPKSHDIALFKEILAGEPFEIGHVARRDGQNEIGVTSDIIALHDLGRRLHAPLEAVDIGLAFVLQRDLDDQDQAASDLSGVYDRNLGFDHARGAQSRKPLAASVRLQAHLRGERVCGQPDVLLKRDENQGVESIHFRPASPKRRVRRNDFHRAENRNESGRIYEIRPKIVNKFRYFVKALVGIIRKRQLYRAQRRSSAMSEAVCSEWLAQLYLFFRRP